MGVAIFRWINLTSRLPFGFNLLSFTIELKTVIIKYNAGNVQSVRYALERLGIEPILSDDEAEIRSADKVIFPGVGEASTAMHYLRSKGLDKLIPTLKQPVFGICLGLQLMCTHSEENNTPGMGIFDVQVKRFPDAKEADGQMYKIPHVGWNSLAQYKGEMTKGLSQEAFVYFVHSYYAELSEHTAAVTDYILPFSAMLQKDNFYAAQFHTEKSSKEGEKILKNFLSL